MTLADKARNVINFLVDNRQNYDEPTASQVIAALMELDSTAEGRVNEFDQVTFTFSDGSKASFGNPDDE